MKKFLNKKILFILSLFLFFLFLNTSSSFAYSIDTDFALSPNYNIDWINSYLDLNQDPTAGIKAMIDSHQDYFNFTSNDLGYYWILERFDYNDPDDGSSKYSYLFYFGESTIWIRSYLGTESSYWNTVWINPDNRFSILITEDGFYSSPNLDSVNGTLSSSSGKYFYYFDLYGDVYSRSVILANHDIYREGYTSESDEPVFQLPELEKATILAPVIQREKTKGTLQVVLKEIIKILPLIIVVVVSLVGLRKALKMLFQLLRQS